MKSSLLQFKSFITGFLAALIVLTGYQVQAARESDLWVERVGTYLQTAWSEGRNILINGSNRYLNFGTVSGSSGYGFRDNAGTIEYKNSGGAWAGVGAGAGGGITTLNGLTDTTQTFTGATSSNVGISIVSSGSTHTFTPTVASGYVIPLTASTTEWGNFYSTPSTRITAGTNLSWTANTLNARTQISTSSSVGNLAFWTGTSALGNVATGSLTESVTGLEFNATRGLVGGAAALALTSGYVIPLTASTTQWAAAHASSHSAVVLAGTPNYLTLAGQVITRALINLTSHVTSTLPIANGGTGATSLADLITLATHTTGNFIATITGTANEISVSGSGSEAAAVTLSLPATIDLGGKTSFEIPNGASPTVDATGQIALDTTDNQLVIATGTSARAIPTIMKVWGATIASTSIDFASGGRIPLPPFRDGVIITEVHCYVDGGTSKVINLDTMAGGAQLDSLTCGTTLTSDTAQSANNNLAAGSLMALEFGATTGSVDYVTFSAWGYVLPE